MTDPDGSTDETVSAETRVVRGAAAPDETVRPGGRIGSYEIVRSLGAGGQGAVYEAIDARLGRRVALKVLFRSGSKAALYRFELEAQTLAALDHPGIATVYETGSGGSAPFIAMRLAAGRPLDKSLPAGAFATPRAAAVFVEKAARALFHAHTAGIIHRDVKPQNIMVSPDGEPVLLDFGLARFKDDDGRATVTGELVGTPAYMSPEQAGGDPARVDARADVFSLGVVLFELLARRLPHDGATRLGYLKALTENDAPDVRRFAPTTPVDLAAIVARAIERRAEARYQSMKEFADDLAAFAAGRPVAVRPVTPVGTVVRWVRRKPVAAAAAALAALFVASLLGFGGFFLAKRGDLERGRIEREREDLERRLEGAFLEVGEGRVESARAVFETLAREHPPVAAEAATGLVLAGSIGAVEGFAGAPADDPRFSDAVRAALRYAGARMRQTPATEFEAESAASTDALALFIYGMTEITVGHRGEPDAFPRALALLTRSCLAAERLRPLYVMARAHAAGHARDEKAAREVRAQLRARWPDLPPARHWAGFAVLEFDPAAALEDLEIAKRGGVDPLIVTLAIGRVFEALGRNDEAERLYRDAAAAAGADRTALSSYRFGLARTLGRAGLLEESERLAREAVAANPADDTGRVEWAITLMLAGKAEPALAAVDEVLTRRPRHIEALRLRPALLASLGRKDEIEPAIATAEAGGAAADLSDWRRRKAEIRSLEGRHAEALEILEAEAAAHPESTAALAQSATIRLRMNDKAGAANVLRRVVAKNPKDASATFNLARCLLDLEASEAAETTAERAVQLAPRSYRALCLLAEVRGFLNRQTEAEDLLLEILRDRPQDRGANFFLLQCLMSQARYAEAATLATGMLGRDDLDAALRGTIVEIRGKAEDGRGFEALILALARGEAPPAGQSAPPTAVLARLTLARGLVRASLRFWREAIAAAGADRFIVGHLGFGADAALAVALGRGRDVDRPTDEEKEEARRTGIAWLERALEQIAKPPLGSKATRADRRNLLVDLRLIARRYGLIDADGATAASAAAPPQTDLVRAIEAAEAAVEDD